jgi:type II secretory pathway predicted ATPase ExeA
MLQSVACLVGAGKTASVRTVLAGLDASRHTIIYLPNPMIGVRGLHEMIVATFGGQPRPLRIPAHRPGLRRPGRRTRRTRQNPRPGNR